MPSQKETRELILRKIQENPNWTFKRVTKEAKVNKNTVTNVVKRFRETLSFIRKPGSGKTNRLNTE
jgi:transposase